MAGIKGEYLFDENGIIIGATGGLKAAMKNKELYGPDFYKRIGRDGGKAGTTGGFWYHKYVKGDDEFARKAGAIGGKLSKKGKKVA